MRNRLMTPLRLTLSLVLAGVASTAAAAPAQAAGTEPYAWRNVPVVAGGFVPGIVYNPSEAGLVYARTDIEPRTSLTPVRQWLRAIRQAPGQVRMSRTSRHEASERR